MCVEASVCVYVCVYVYLCAYVYGDRLHILARIHGICVCMYFYVCLHRCQNTHERNQSSYNHTFIDFIYAYIRTYIYTYTIECLKEQKCRLTILSRLIVIKNLIVHFSHNSTSLISANIKFVTKYEIYFFYKFRH